MSNHPDSDLAQIEEILADHSVALRGINDKLDRLFEILSPPDNPGPTLDELLAQLVVLNTDQMTLLKRMDRRTAAIAVQVGVSEDDNGSAVAEPTERPRAHGYVNGHSPAPPGEESPPP